MYKMVFHDNPGNDVEVCDSFYNPVFVASCPILQACKKGRDGYRKGVW